MTKAGHRRAVRRLVRGLVHWRCPSCLQDDQAPDGRPGGLRCPQCGAQAPGVMQFTTRIVPGGFRWVATFIREDSR